ncbi:hypothetical protein ACQPXB_09075 [Amycolatopsis sp. CA-161197]|uniref:hypothetical protein n=1 Tax=Amycolatopsis sp. CA-161197 TaxID=3239922 RepID=UPI003D8D0F83
MTADRATDTNGHPTTAEHAEEDHAALVEPIDPEGLEYWQRTCATWPPMTAEEIETLAVVLRRIDQRTTE